MFETIEHDVDFCVVGGGLSGLCAAVSAARHGAKVALMQERPMLGGNASSEIRMWVCGANGANMRETGLIEELMLENQFRNADKNYSVWDSVLYGMVRQEKNITLLLNCTCVSCEAEEGRIVSATGWQMTTQQYHRVRARYFADCSGDSVLGYLAGADWRMGRESRAEFGETIAPEQADQKTMGLSCLLTAREETKRSVFIPPAWARHITSEQLHQRMPDLTRPSENFWYLELGGSGHAIADTERVRDELLSLAYGLWDYIKNAPENREKYANWTLEWVGILPGKRESRRLMGDYIMTEHDVRSGGHFDDLVAYGGWTLDDHDPAGFEGKGAPNIHHPAPSPYGISYRCLYSRNVENLFFAGRNISVTHAAMSSTRVMATCALLGQAVGTAAALAIEKRCAPREVGTHWIDTLRQTLMEDDCYLPFAKRKIPDRTCEAVPEPPEAEILRNGVDRPVDGADNGWFMASGETVGYRFSTPCALHQARIIFDSDLNRETLPKCEGSGHKNMPACRTLSWTPSCVPKTLVKRFRIKGLTDAGEWITLYTEDCNYQRLRVIPIQGIFKALYLTPLETWGAAQVHLFAFDVR